MIALRRLSTVPTIPEMMRTETDLRWASFRGGVRLLQRSLEAEACFALATVVLLLARLLLWLRLIEPRFAAGSLGLATRLSSRGMRAWRRHRSDGGRRG